MVFTGEWKCQRKAERSCKSEERVENCTLKVKNEWEINGNRVLVSTQISQFWDTADVM